MGLKVAILKRLKNLHIAKDERDEEIRRFI
jgi:hypothetical protein